MAALLLVGASAHADTLRYRHGLPPLLRQEVQYLGSTRLQPEASKPDLQTEPQLEGQPVYFLIRLGEEGNPPYVALFDPGGNKKKGTLYFDTDGDGDLAEEQPLSAERWDQADNFGPIAVRLKREGFTGLYHFWLQVRRYGGSTGDRWYLRPGCYNVGEVTVDGVKHRAASIDARANGVFNDVWIGDRSGGDRFYVDWNDDGKFSSDEMIYCGERQWHEGRWYRLSFSADGTELSLGPGDFEFGTLVTGLETFSLQLMSRSKAGYFKVGGSGGRVELPADDYVVHNCWCEQDDDGRTWVAEGRGGPYANLTVKAGQETEFAFGPPFTATLVARAPGPYRSSQTISFDAKTYGVEGKNYTFTRDGRRQPAPKMVISDAKGKKIGSYAFQYG